MPTPLVFETMGTVVTLVTTAPLDAATSDAVQDAFRVLDERNGRQEGDDGSHGVEDQGGRHEAHPRAGRSRAACNRRITPSPW